MNVFRSQHSREVQVFLAASLINATGSALMWPLISMYVFDELGRSMADAGLAILIQSLGGIAGQLIGGALYNRVGVKRLVVGAMSLNALVLFTLPLISHTWLLFISALGLAGLFNALSTPAIQSFIGFRFSDRRAEMFNTVYVANNIGVALGTALSGFLADISYSLTFIANGVSCAFFATFFLFYLKRADTSSREAAGHPPLSGVKSGKAPSNWALLLNFRLYLFMALGALLLHIGNSMWNTGVSPFIIAEGMPKKAYGFLWTLNGILIFAAQPIISLIKRYAARKLTSQMAVSSLLYASGYCCVLGFQSYPGMVLGMVLATFGEMLISPTIPAYLSEHGGKSAPFYIGLTGGIGAGGRVIGPYVMGSLYDAGGLPPVAWLAIGTALVSAASYTVHAVWNRSRGLDANRQTPAEADPSA